MTGAAAAALCCWCLSSMRLVQGLTCALQGNASASATAVSQALSQGASAPTIGQAVGQVVTHCCSLQAVELKLNVVIAYDNLHCRLAAQYQ